MKYDSIITREANSLFFCAGKIYKVLIYPAHATVSVCSLCEFYNRSTCTVPREKVGHCADILRKDNNTVYFKVVQSQEVTEDESNRKTT